MSKRPTTITKWGALQTINAALIIAAATFGVMGVAYMTTFLGPAVVAMVLIHSRRQPFGAGPRIVITVATLVVANVPTILHGFPVPAPAAEAILEANPGASLDYMHRTLGVGHVLCHVYAAMVCMLVIMAPPDRIEADSA